MNSSFSKDSCELCRVPKAPYTCSVCSVHACKSCIQQVSERIFEYAPKPPENTEPGVYCWNCYEARIVPHLQAYEEVLERAKEVHVLMKAYRGFVPVLKKAQFEIEVKDTEDRKDAILKLAYLAAQEGYNALLHTDVYCEKRRPTGYQKSWWQGTALPAKINEEKLMKHEYLEEVWRRGD